MKEGKISPQSVINCSNWPMACKHTPPCQPKDETMKAMNDLLRMMEIRSADDLAAMKQALIVCMPITVPPRIRKAKARKAGVCGCRRDVSLPVSLSCLIRRNDVGIML